MKRTLPIALVALFTMLVSPAFAGSGRGGCAQKEQAIMKQLEIARQYNNRGKIMGLERALANVRTWCSDGGLLNKAEEKIEEKQDKVREREEELAEAVAEGKEAKKVAKRELKLREARSELQEAVKERDSLLKSIDVEEK